MGPEFDQRLLQSIVRGSKSWLRLHNDLLSCWWDVLHELKQFDPGQTRETGADLDPNHLTSVTGKGMGSGIFFVFLEGLGEHCRLRPNVASCSVWSDSIVPRCAYFEKLIK